MVNENVPKAYSFCPYFVLMVYPEFGRQGARRFTDNLKMVEHL
jgi:hypothetical protein